MILAYNILPSNKFAPLFLNLLQCPCDSVKLSEQMKGNMENGDNKMTKFSILGKVAICLLPPSPKYIKLMDREGLFRSIAR